MSSMTWRLDEDICGTVEWNLGASAPTYSQLAGLLAGFVFTVIVLLLSKQHRATHDAQVLSVFLSAFAVLGLASYSYGVISGETAPGSCGRAATEVTVAAGLLGMGAVAIVVSLAWLVTDFTRSADMGRAERSDPENGLEDPRQALGTLMNVLVRGLATMVSLLLGTNIADYTDLAIGRTLHPVLFWTISVAPVLLLITATSTLNMAARQWFSPSWRNRKLLHSTLLVEIMFAIVATGYIAVIASTPLDRWTPIPTWAAVTTPVLTTVVPVLVLATLITALPRSSRHNR